VQNAPAIVQVAALHLRHVASDSQDATVKGDGQLIPGGPGGLNRWCHGVVGMPSPLDGNHLEYSIFLHPDVKKKQSSVHLFIPVIKCYKYDFLMLQKITWNFQLPDIFIVHQA